MWWHHIEAVTRISALWHGWEKLVLNPGQRSPHGY
nr:DUF4913 domain-containing protein [Arthrobacter polaris]